MLEFNEMTEGGGKEEFQTVFLGGQGCSVPRARRLVA